MRRVWGHLSSETNRFQNRYFQIRFHRNESENYTNSTTISAAFHQFPASQNHCKLIWVPQATIMCRWYSAFFIFHSSNAVMWKCIHCDIIDVVDVGSGCLITELINTIGHSHMHCNNFAGQSHVSCVIWKFFSAFRAFGKRDCIQYTRSHHHVHFWIITMILIDFIPDEYPTKKRITTP